MNDDELSTDELDEYLNEIRDYGVDVESLADAAGWDVDDGVVSL
jgi:hypothetical protein